MTESNDVAGSGVRKRSRTYRAGVALAVVASLLTVWTTVVRDDGNGIGFFMVIMAVGIGWFAAQFRPAGMARTMIGVAVMQAVLGCLIATAPVTANAPGGSKKSAAVQRLLRYVVARVGLLLSSGCEGRFIRDAG